MIYSANFYQMTVEDHTFWVAESNALKGCVGQGDTFEEAVKELELNEHEWIETAKSVGIPVPPVKSKKPNIPSGKISLRTSPLVHANVCRAAKDLGISVNQFANDALIDYTNKVNNFISVASIQETESKIIASVIPFPKSKDNPYTSVINELEEM